VLRQAHGARLYMIHDMIYMGNRMIQRVFGGARNGERGPRSGCMNGSHAAASADLCGEAISINKLLKQLIMTSNPCGFSGSLNVILYFSGCTQHSNQYSPDED